MRVPVSLLIASAAAFAALPTVAQAPAAPQRKAGWWEITMQMSAPMPMTQKMNMCTDAATEAKVSAFNSGMQNQGPCGQASVRRTAQGWAFDNTCTTGGMTMTTSGLASGDFQSSYRIESTTKMSPAPMPQMAESKMVMTARWLGACPANRKPGDMVMGNGMTVNVAR